MFNCNHVINHEEHRSSEQEREIEPEEISSGGVERSTTLGGAVRSGAARRNIHTLHFATSKSVVKIKNVRGENTSCKKKL